MKDRSTYNDIKSWVLSSYWNRCLNRSHLTRDKENSWTHYQIAYSIYDDFENGTGAFDSVLEYLMLEVICLTLSCWYPEDVAYHTRQINEYLANNSLAEMLKDIPKEEADDFLSDLRILGFLEKGTVLSPTITVP